MAFEQFNRNEDPSLQTARISRFGRRIIFDQYIRGFDEGVIGLFWNEETHQIGVTPDERGNFLSKNRSLEWYAQEISARSFIKHYKIPRNTEYWAEGNWFDLGPDVILTPKEEYWR